METQKTKNKTLAGAPQEVFDYIELCNIKTAAKKLDEVFKCGECGLLNLSEAEQWAEYRDWMKHLQKSLKWLIKEYNLKYYRPLNESDFFKSVEIYRNFIKEINLNKISLYLAYNPELEDKFKTTVETIWGREWRQNELDAFKHWLWLVKRNI